MWITRNKTIFESKKLVIFKAMSSIVNAFKERSIPKETNKSHILNTPRFNYNHNWRFFDCVRQGQQNSCGVGMVLYIYHSKFDYIKMEVGHGSNTKTKLLALCGLLYFSNHIKLEKL